MLGIMGPSLGPVQGGGQNPAEKAGPARVNPGLLQGIPGSHPSVNSSGWVKLVTDVGPFYRHRPRRWLDRQQVADLLAEVDGDAVHGDATVTRSPVIDQ